MKGNHPQAQKGLLFIPDISGFTEFVTQTEANHAQHIIEELLEVLIDTNQLDLELSEIEGDAILFYRFGAAPKAIELLDQVQQMFVNFHNQLRKYETQRICHCGACRSINQLTLKFVAHYGKFSKNQIKEHRKLFGKEVIVAHRLLKNDIENHEYLMVTQPLRSACSTWESMEDICWGQVVGSSQEYDSGKINYSHVALEPLLRHVQAPQVKDYSLSGVQAQLGELKATIEAPMEEVFNVLIDLPFRNQWQVGLDPNWTIDHLNGPISQQGATHRCFDGGPIIVTHGIETSQDVIHYTETITREQLATVFTLRRLGKKMTQVKISIFMKASWWKELIYKFFFKSKLEKNLTQSLVKLNQYCEQLQIENKAHPTAIVLPFQPERLRLEN